MGDDRPLGQCYDGVVCDLDGVVRRGSQAVPHAVEQLLALRASVVYATNNASLTPQDVAAQLTGLGLTVGPEAVVTSSQAGAAHVAALFPAGSTVLAVGGPGVAAALREVGLTAVPAAQDGVVAVLQGYGPQVTATDLAEASYAIQGGARWVATNRDATLPTHRGVAPGNGALLAAVALATGQQPVAVGKPEPPLYDLAVDRLGASADHVLAIGDRLDTDIVGAIAAGLDSLWVLSGVDDLMSFARAPGQPAPTYVAADLRALSGRPQRATRVGDSEWVCDDARLSVDWPAGQAEITGRMADVRAADALSTVALAALVDGRDDRGATVDALGRVAAAVTDRLRAQ